MPGFAARFLVTFVGLWLADLIFDGVTFASGMTLAIAALLLGVANAVVRPIAIVLTLPVTLVTLGLFLFVVNAAMVGLVAWLLPGFGVAGFGTALGTSILVSLTSTVASWYIGPRGTVEVMMVRRP